MIEREPVDEAAVAVVETWVELVRAGEIDHALRLMTLEGGLGLLKAGVETYAERFDGWERGRWGFAHDRRRLADGDELVVLIDLDLGLQPVPPELAGEHLDGVGAAKVLRVRGTAIGWQIAGFEAAAA